MRDLIFKILSSLLSNYHFAMLKRVYLHLRYKKIPKGLNFKNPSTFSEKINYLKLFKTQKTGSIFADKIEVKKFINEKFGDKYLIPTIATFDSVDEIDWEKLPKSFVIKATHSSGMNFICADKSLFDENEIKEKMRAWLKVDYAKVGGEWQYNLQPRLICEEYLENTKENSLLDYKFFCFNGEAKYVQVDIDRNKSHARNFYDLNWNLQDFYFVYPNSDTKVEKPAKFEEMVNVVNTLSDGLPFMRVDLYFYKDRIYFGEMTFHPEGGCGFFVPYEIDMKLGELIKL